MEGAWAPAEQPPSDLKSEQLSRLTHRDFALLTAFCLILFGYYMFCGRPLSLHEARLPQTSREMMMTRSWLFPQSGGRPWLERPPVPHWILIAASVALGQHCDKEWIVRLPSVLMGLSVVLMTAWMASVWFGRNVGVLSGLVLATMYEFYTYSILAEDDIFLAAAVTGAVALFVATEFNPGRASDGRSRLFGNRPWRVWAFFILLGLMNLIKSPVLGTIAVLGPAGAFLLWNADVSRIRRYVWAWGVILMAVLGGAWMVGATQRFPDVLRNWKFDYKNTTDYDQPFWYYPIVVLLGLCMPWILASISGFMATWRDAIRRPGSGARFLWCWAIVPVIELSIPHRKHHHYLVPSLAPWAILSAVGLAAIWHSWTQRQLTDRQLTEKQNRPVSFILPAATIAILAVVSAVLFFSGRIHVAGVPFVSLIAMIGACIAVFFLGLARSSGALAAGACFVGIAFAYCWGQSFSPDMVAADTAFLRQVEAQAPLDQPLYVNGDLAGELDFFRNQFYLRRSAILLHNLTYLRDQKITSPDAWVVTRQSDAAKLQKLGDVEVALTSVKTRREKSPLDRFTLFHLHFDPKLQRYPRPAYVNTLQAMGREKGPYCGPPL